MINLEQVEELRKRANISYEEAKSFRRSKWRYIEAIIYLEKQNKIKAPEDGGYYSTKG